MAPNFSQHYAYRVTKHWPFSGGTEASAEGWISEQQPPALLDAPTMIGRLDAWWPAILATFDGPRATATISFMAELLADPATLSPEPFFYRGNVVAIEEGFFVELRELWQDGRLVALNQQTFAPPLVTRGEPPGVVLVVGANPVAGVVPIPRRKESPACTFGSA